MPSETVQLDWIQGQEFLLRDRHGFPIPMTQPAGVNAADLLPLSLIGCSAWDVVSMLRKQRQRVTAFQITAESEQEAEPPWRFVKIAVRYRITGENLSGEAIERAIELTEQKYCATFATLRRAVEITSTYEVIEAGPETGAEGHENG